MADSMIATTSQLTVLHANLTALGAARRRVRGAAAWSAVGTVAVVCILSFWALDVLFEMSVAQRCLMLLISAGAIAWAFQRLAQPLLGIHESEIELALLVERRQDIDSDLVAALQFEDPRARDWGSPQLESAVIQYVSEIGNRLNVFDGFDSQMLTRRATWFGSTALVLGLLVAVFPGHARALLDRLLLGHRHYPTRTVIEQVVVNQQQVLARADDGTSPRGARAAQAHSVRFWVQCSGSLPPAAQLRLTGDTTHAARQIELVRLTLDQRQQQLDAIAELLQRVAAGAESPPSGMRLAEVLAALRTDAPEAAASWPDEAADAVRWHKVGDGVRSVLANWPGRAASVAVYQGELGRLVDSVSYKLSVGDAWTDPAAVAMIPLPVVEPRIEVTPPDYAAAASSPVDVAARQLSVLEGSQVQIGLRCTNRKPLAAAWMTWQSAEGPRSLPLEAADAERSDWRLPVGESPLGQIREEARFDLQVRDQDGLQLESPIGMLIRIRADRAPTASMEVVHRVVLPGARPKLEYRVNDDFGIGKVDLHVEIESGQNGPASRRAGGAAQESDEPALQRRSLPLLAEGKVLGPSELPRIASYELDLRPFGLSKGDRLKLTLEVADHRGATPGEVVASEALYLEISDESGVLAAILEADERSEQRLTEIIKRQLGIGESQ